MAAATTLPEDFTLEYDLLQLVDDHAFNSSSSNNAPTTTNTSHTLDVDELLRSSFGSSSVDALGGIDPSDIHATVCTRTPEQLVKHADCLLSLTTDVDVPTNNTNATSDDALTELLFTGDAFMAELEKAVAMDVDTYDHNAPPSSSSATSPCSSTSSSACNSTYPQQQQLHDVDTTDELTDCDVVSSPCPSSCTGSNANNTSPKRLDSDSELDELLLRDDEYDDASIWNDAAFVAALPPTQTQLMALLEPPAAMQTQTQTQTTIDLTLGDDDDENRIESDDDEEEDDEQAAVAAKHDAELLQKEAKYLEAQYDYLVSRAQATAAATSSRSASTQRTSIKAPKRSRKATKKNTTNDADAAAALTKSTSDSQLLTDLVTQQQVYLDNLKAMLSFAPVNDIRLALMTPMESYIHLGRGFDDRRKTILSLREEKLDMTYKYIEQKAQGLTLDQPYQYSDMFEKFGKNYCVNFAISRYDDVGVLAIAGAIYEQIAGKDEDLTAKMGCLTVRESYDQIRCNFMHQRIVSSMQWGDAEAMAMPDIESNAIFYNRFSDNVAVMATDYIDQDDLHPYDGNNRIRKDVSSGVVLTGHVDANGKNYVIMKRFLMAKFHMFPHQIPQDQQDRFFAKMPLCHDKMKTLIVDKLARTDSGEGGEMHSCTHSGNNVTMDAQTM